MLPKFSRFSACVSICLGDIFLDYWHSVIRGGKFPYPLIFLAGWPMQGEQIRRCHLRLMASLRFFYLMLIEHPIKWTFFIDRQETPEKYVRSKNRIQLKVLCIFLKRFPETRVMPKNANFYSHFFFFSFLWKWSARAGLNGPVLFKSCEFHFHIWDRSK